MCISIYMRICIYGPFPVCIFPLVKKLYINRYDCMRVHVIFIHKYIYAFIGTFIDVYTTLFININDYIYIYSQVSLINFKALRLSVFLASTKNGGKPQPFSHTKVLRYTLYVLLYTFILLTVGHTLDPPVPTVIVNDIYRPKYDTHFCKTEVGLMGPLILVVVLSHFVMTIYCVAAIRNGLEAFHDGTIIKEVSQK